MYGDGTFDQLIPVGNILGVVDVIHNTAVQPYDLQGEV